MRTGPTVVSNEGLRGKIEPPLALVVPFGARIVRGTEAGMPLPVERVVGAIGRVGIVRIVRIWLLLLIAPRLALLPLGSTVRGMSAGMPLPVRIIGASKRGTSAGITEERMIRGTLGGTPLAGTVGAIGKAFGETGASGRTALRGGVLSVDPILRLELMLPSGRRICTLALPPWSPARTRTPGAISIRPGICTERLGTRIEPPGASEPTVFRAVLLAEPLGT